MKIGVSVGNVGPVAAAGGSDACLAIARRADELGFDSVWVSDHIAVPVNAVTPYPYRSDRPPGSSIRADVTYEPLTMMCAIAACTQRVSIGCSVLVLPYRHPVIPAKMLAAADLVSRGRVILGVGTGWLPEEFSALGLPPEHFERRGAVTTEYIRAIKEMWTATGPSHFEGEFVRFDNVGTFPKPYQKPHPPIVVGGKGTNAAKRASLLGDGYQAIAATPEELAEEVELLRAACRQDRRDPAELEVSMLGGRLLLTSAPAGADRPLLTGTPDELITDLRRFAVAGLQHLIVSPAHDSETDPLASALKSMDVLAEQLLPLLR